MTPLFRYPDFDRRVAFVDAQLDTIRAIPGVIGAAAISRIPLTVTDQATFYLLAGQSNSDASNQVALSRVVTRDYFSTVGARLGEGRSSTHPTCARNRLLRSSMILLPLAIFPDAQRLAHSSNSDGSARRATGTPSSAS